MLGPHLLLDLEQLVTRVQGNLKEAQDRQKSYADKKKKDRDYQVGEHVYLKVKSKQSSLILGRCGKLAPRFCRSFEILAKKGPVAYELALPVHVIVHNVFHVSLLKNMFMILNMLLIGPCYRWNMKGSLNLNHFIY